MMEPERQSVLEMVNRTLKVINRVTYVHRLIYCGEHMFEKSDTTLQEAMEQAVQDTNNDFCYERLTGLLLYYPNYFIHLVDGSEDSLLKHVQILIQNYGKYLGRMKVVVTSHHINQRFFHTWAYRTAKPPTLLEKINPLSDEEECFRYVDICIQKMYNLATKLRVRKYEEDPDVLPIFSIGHIGDNMMEFLPEYTLLDFILNLQLVEDLKAYIALYMNIPYILFSDGLVWPVRMDFVPQDVFDVEQEMIPDLPTN